MSSLFYFILYCGRPKHVTPQCLVMLSCACRLVVAVVTAALRACSSALTLLAPAPSTSSLYRELRSRDAHFSVAAAMVTVSAGSENIMRSEDCTSAGGIRALGERHSATVMKWGTDSDTAAVTEWGYGMIHTRLIVSQTYHYCLLYTSPSPRDS